MSSGASLSLFNSFPLDCWAWVVFSFWNPRDGVSLARLIVRFRQNADPVVSVASKDRNAVALKNLSTIRGLDSEHPYVVNEIADIHNALERDRAMCGAGFAGPLKALFQSKAYLRRLGIAIMLFACQNGTGINAINYYSPVSSRRPII
jgi:hypothetical protein